MSEPVHILNIPIVINGDMTTTIHSPPTNLDTAASYSVQAVFTGSPMGTLQLEGSNDNDDVIPTNWTIITDSVQGITVAGSYLVNVEFPVYCWVRLSYLPTAGSGNLNARINAKRR